MRIPSGVTDQYIYFVAVDSTDFTTRETGLSSFTVYRSRNGGTAAAMTTPTINETDTTNMPGVYELLLDEDMTIDSGDDSQEMVFHITHAGMAPVTRTIELYRPKVTAGETLTTSSGVASTNVVAFNGTTLGTGSIPELGIIDSGTAQSATSTTLVLRAGADFGADDSIIGSVVLITGGTTGVGESRIITDLNNSTDTITVDAWTTTPTGTITYIVFASPQSSSTLPFPADMVSISGDTVAADNLEAMFDGTGYSNTNAPATQGGVTTVDTGVNAIKAVTDLLPDAGALTSIATAAALATVDSNVDAILVDTGTTLDANITAIKAKTDSLTFTQAGVVDSNIQMINDVTITGNGGTGTEFSV